MLNSLGKFGGNPWDALRASRILASKKPSSSILVLPPGLEPGTNASKAFMISVSPREQIENLINIEYTNIIEN